MPKLKKLINTTVNNKKIFKKIVLLIVLISIVHFVFNSIRIYNYSFDYHEDISDVAIVLGAGTRNNEVSPVFRERINHSLFLYKNSIVKKIIITGGKIKNQKYSDSEIAKNYAVANGVHLQDILIEKKSRYTIENLSESKLIMDSLNFQTALIVSDPLHMKRAMGLAGSINLNCKSSPTQTSMYKSQSTKFKSLIYETFFYSFGEIVGKN